MDVRPLVYGHTAMHGAGRRRHLRAVTARHLRGRFTGTRLRRPREARTALGTQVGAIEGAPGGGGNRCVLTGLAVIDLGVCHDRTGEEESDGEGRGEN